MDGFLKTLSLYVFINFYQKYLLQCIPASRNISTKRLADIKEAGLFKNERTIISPQGARNYNQ